MVLRILNLSDKNLNLIEIGVQWTIIALIVDYLLLVERLMVKCLMMKTIIRGC